MYGIELLERGKPILKKRIVNALNIGSDIRSTRLTLQHKREI